MSLMLALPPSALAKKSHSEDTKWESTSTTSAKMDPLPEDDVYPDSALRAAYEAELKQMRQTEEAQHNEVMARDAYDRRKAEAEDEISRHRKQVEALRREQEKSAETVEAMRSELAEIQRKEAEMKSELRGAEMKSRNDDASAENVRKELNEAKARLQKSVSELQAKREDTVKLINRSQIETQQLRMQIMQTETAISRAENDKMRVEQEELRVRTEWAALTVRNREANREKARTLAELDDMNRRLEKARRDYGFAKRESEQLEAEVRQLDLKARMNKTYILNELRKLEEEIAAAYNVKARNEAEKVRLVAEVDRLKEELRVVKERHTRAIAEGDDSEQVVMESRLAFETAKADLARQYAALEKTKVDNDTKRLNARNIASMAETSDILSGQQTARVSRNCPLRRAPASDGQPDGDIKAGARVYVSPGKGQWYKILNSSGHVLYVDEGCLKFEN